MEEMFARVTDTTALEPSIAKAAIGYVLLFLRDEAPMGKVPEFISKTPRAQEFVNAALARSDAGVTQVVEGMTSFMGHGRADLNILAGKLANLGLSETQTESLLRAVLDRAEVLIGGERIAQIREMLPELKMRSAPYDKLQERRAL